MPSTRPMGWRALLACGLAAVAGPALAADDACRPNPLGERTLHLRGSFNGWATPDEHRFVWACDRFELVATFSGDHRFKVGDEDWSADADFGGVPGAEAAPGTVPPPMATLPLRLRGADLQRRLDGTWRFVVRWPAGTSAAPTLEIGRCPDGPPLGATTLFLRGTMNNWASLEDGEFQWRCDAYWLNLSAQGAQAFKIADASWTPSTTFGRSSAAMVGAGPGDAPLPLRRGSDPGGTGDIAATFSGEHTLRLAFDGGVPTLTIGPRRFADPRAVTLRDPLALALRHDSRDARHRAPFGAVKAGTTVQLAVQAPPGVESITLVIERRRHEGNQEVVEYLPVARVPMRREATPSAPRAAASGNAAPAAGPWKAAAATAPASAASAGAVATPAERWTARYRFAEMGVHGYWFEARIGGKAYALQNNADAVHWTREKGTGGVGSVAPLPARLASIRRYRVSVYDPAFTVPTWAPDAVVYTIYPDRYRNGDASNDPKPGTRRYQDHDIEFHTRWLDKPWRPGTGDGSDGVHNNDFFGGDLAGIIAKLDELKALGVNTLYILPIFHAASNHKYDTADYRHIDPAFGTDADYTRLTVEARRRGMRVIADTSLNHTGSDSAYFDRFGNFGQGGAFEGGRIRPESRYAGWYRFDPTQTEPDKQYRGWVGVNDLPELDKASPAWRDFAYRANDSVTRLWLQRGASGWRMDVAPWVPDDFWREWRQVVKATKPDAITIAETWFDPSRHLLGDMFDSTMNYIFRNAVLDYAKGGPATALAGQLEMLREAVPPPAHAALMNLLSSHDVARALHVLGFEGEATPAERVALAKQRLVLATFLQMTYPGAPAIYYGDEVGMTGGDDPYNRGTYPWPELGGQPDGALRDTFRQLIALRRAHPVLRHGSLEAPLLAEGPLLVQLRHWRGTWALTATNNGAEPRTVRVALPAAAARQWVQAQTGARLHADDAAVVLTVPPMSGRLWVGRRGAR